MIRATSHRIIGCGQSAIVVLIMVMVMTTPGHAGVGLPPMPDPADTNAMEQYRVRVFYEAQKSEQERIRVGQERYELMLTNRANLLRAIAVESAVRKQMVNIPSQPAKGESSKNSQPDTWLDTSIGAAVIGLCCFGFRFYLNRQNLKDVASQRY